MFQTITFKGFEAQVTAHVTDGYQVGTVYLEMAGAEAEVRAIWSRLVSAKMKKSGYDPEVSIGSDQPRMEKNTKYLALCTVLPNGQRVVVQNICEECKKGE